MILGGDLDVPMFRFPGLGWVSEGEGGGPGRAAAGAGRAGNLGSRGSRVRARTQAGGQPGRWAWSPNRVWVGGRAGRRCAWVLALGWA
jgi:hypothetical protein